jgi:hypothetical protein
MDPKKPQSPESSRDTSRDATDDVIRIEDLAPRDDVKGGRKIVLGEIISEPSAPDRDTAE